MIEPVEGSTTGIICLRRYVHVSPFVDFAGLRFLLFVYVFSIFFGMTDRASITPRSIQIMSFFSLSYQLVTFLCGAVLTYICTPTLHVESVALTV